MAIDPTRKGSLAYTFPVYVDQIEPEGFLTTDVACHACWYYFVLAKANQQNIGTGKDSQIILEGDLWMTTRYENIARGVAAMYGLESPEEFLKYMPRVEKEARRVGTHVPGGNQECISGDGPEARYLIPIATDGTRAIMCQFPFSTDAPERIIWRGIPYYFDSARLSSTDRGWAIVIYHSHRRY